jgi:8-oxo-dGTP pyrophosphatase MutT (NUDIX family)
MGAFLGSPRRVAAPSGSETENCRRRRGRTLIRRSCFGAAAAFPIIGLCHAFVWALIVSSDDALIYGVMGGQTANAGRVYPPGGSLEPRDVLPDGQVDALRAIELELVEETGLVAGDAETGMTVVVLDGPRLSIGRVFRFAEPEADLLARIRANLAVQEHRELADVIAIRSPEDAERVGAVPYAIAVARAFAAGEIV